MSMQFRTGASRSLTGEMSLTMELSSEDFPTLDLPMKAISGTELLKAGRESGDMSEPRKEKRDFCRDLEIDDVSEVHFRVMEVGIVGGVEPSG